MRDNRRNEFNGFMVTMDEIEQYWILQSLGFAMPSTGSALVSIEVYITVVDCRQGRNSKLGLALGVESDPC